MLVLQLLWLRRRCGKRIQGRLRDVEPRATFYNLEQPKVQQVLAHALCRLLCRHTLHVRHEPVSGILPAEARRILDPSHAAVPDRNAGLRVHQCLAVRGQTRLFFTLRLL